MTSSACGAHPQRTAAARCAACSARVCSACFRFLVSERPSCAKCAFIERTSGPRRTSLALSFVLLAAGIAFALVHAELIDLAIAFVTDGIAVLIAVAGWLIARRPQREVRELEEEEAPALSAPMAGSAHPYRGLVRRAALAAAPKVSGTTVVLVVLASLALSGVLAPAALRLPVWIEAEIAIALSFVALAAVLSVLLYRGYRLRDDFVFVAPWERLGGGGGGSTKGRGSLDGCSGIDGEGLAVIVLLAVALFGALVLVELVVPLVFLLAYALVMKALKTAAHDRHGCEGRLARSIGWGAGWALVFVVPVALLVAAVHFARLA